MTAMSLGARSDRARVWEEKAMTLTRWSPLTGLATLEVDSLNRMFESAFAPLAPGGWIPAVDIQETADKDVIVKVDLPEMKREDIAVTFEHNVLTIAGERKLSDPGEAATYHRVERGSGAFHRSFTLPSTVDGSRVQAAYRDGVLTITLPRREEARPRQIPMNG